MCLRAVGGTAGQRGGILGSIPGVTCMFLAVADSGLVVHDTARYQIEPEEV